MNSIVPSALAQGTAKSSGADPFGLVIMIGLFVIFYLMLIRPQRKRQKEHANMVENLAKGDEVITSAGLLGRITKLDGDYAVLRVADNVELKFQKMSIQAVLPKGTLKSIGGAGD